MEGYLIVHPKRGIYLGSSQATIQGVSKGMVDVNGETKEAEITITVKDAASITAWSNYVVNGLHENIEAAPVYSVTEAAEEIIDTVINPSLLKEGDEEELQLVEVEVSDIMKATEEECVAAGFNHWRSV
jgi:hypothetical protein